VAGFDFPQGAWIAVEDLDLTRFIRWVLHEQTTPHQLLPRYRSVWFLASRGYRRRQMIWTTERSVDEEARHEAMRQRQDAWKHQQEEKKRQAEQLRKEEEARRREAVLQEEERQRKITNEKIRAMREAQEHQWAIDAEQFRLRREAEERLRKEQAAAAEQERLRQEQYERRAAARWWQELSPSQVQQLRAAVADPLWKKDLTRVEFDPQGATADNGYGVAIYVRRRLHGILRPSPASLRRLPPAVAVFVRNAREAQLLTSTGDIEPACVVHLNLPDHEQIALI
jgi:hypothetical protein